MIQEKMTNDEILNSLQTPQLDETGRVDLELLLHRLSLTPGERLDENDRLARFLETARCAGREALGRDE